MLDGCVAAHDRLGGAELEQQVGPLGGGRWLGERAAEIGDRALGSTARAGALGGVAQRPDDLCVRGGGSAEQVRGDPLRLGAGVGEETRRPCVPAVSLEGCE
jgi:hypothetical protein